MSRTSILSVCFVLLALCTRSNATDVVVLQGQHTSAAGQQLKSALNFYGLQETVIPVSGSGSSSLAQAVQRSQTIAVAISADALQSVNKTRFLSALDRRPGSKLPVLIFGINGDTRSEDLREWSQGTVTGSKPALSAKTAAFYQFGHVSGITQQLSGIRGPVSSHDLQYLVVAEPRIEAIMSAGDSEQMSPVFVRAYAGNHAIFLAASIGAPDIPSGPSPYREVPVFASLAPEMIFLRYAAGDRAWHSPGQYANFTIDDTWLREPYGYVNYEALLREMEAHNFHTTIAFIPWNYDRSQPAMVSLFREHPDRYSICIHGNNHDHQEFGSYTDKPLAGQAQDIKQALARMSHFQQLTGIGYDPVMVFPHSISPEKTFALLKKYNFLGTANSLNVPMDAQAPAGAEFALRTATMTFADFPSLRRYSAEAPGPPAQLVIDAFLGNPILFYGHEAFFHDGINAFDPTADTVNRLAPAEWKSLGYIAQHLYLVKLRDDGDYDVRLYGTNIHLENPSATNAVFHIEKQEDFAFPLTVSADGHPYSYQRSRDALEMNLPIRAHGSSQIEIKYANDLNIANVDVSKKSLRIMMIRHLSDFRDDVVSKTAAGRWFIGLYVSAEDAGGKMRLLATAGILVLVLIIVLVRRAKRRSELFPSHSVSMH